MALYNLVGLLFGPSNALGFDLHLLAPPGSSWLLLAPPGSSWLPLVPPGSSESAGRNLHSRYGSAVYGRIEQVMDKVLKKDQVAFRKLLKEMLDGSSCKYEVHLPAVPGVPPPPSPLPNEADEEEEDDAV